MRKIRKLLYNTKQTSANTTYLSLEDTDREILFTSMIGIMCYMQELCLCKNQEVKDFINWYTRPHKRYQYNNKLKRNNSPQSFLAGTLNNLQFGTQHDFSLTQLETIQDILNTSIDIIDAIREELQIDLQNNPLFTKIWIQENLWQSN